MCQTNYEVWKKVMAIKLRTNKPINNETWWADEGNAKKPVFKKNTKEKILKIRNVFGFC